MRVEEIVAKILEIDPNEINDMTGPANTPVWDSFNGLLLVTELEKNFKVNFSIDEVVAVKNVRDIKAALRVHGVRL